MLAIASTALTRVNECVVQLASGLRHAHLLNGCNVAFIAAWCDAHQWPDVAFVHRFVLGFPVVGDIPDSGLFRPCFRPATAPADLFSADNNRRWTDAVVRRVVGLASSKSAKDVEVVRAVWERTRAEACKGYVQGPYACAQADLYEPIGIRVLTSRMEFQVHGDGLADGGPAISGVLFQRELENGNTQRI
ncbi:hypothetical protein AB1Y20_009304 [Prymnesium parvum]|uniref:Uncharacterized protein n=1 Tax=Prymnesium parvum TaxID=97485 RepID=A0AB34K3G4_PRYPA